MTVTMTMKPAEPPKGIHHRALLAKIPLPGQTPWHIALLPAIPNLEPGQVLIKTTYVALNPFDWQGVAFRYGIGPEAKVMGRDGAGVVVGVGKGVAQFKQGDRVWFCADSSQNGTGAFQEYSVHSACNVGHTPCNLSDEQAATLGTGLITAGVALFRTIGLPMEDLSKPKQTRRDEWILIWGGSGITGVYLIQLAKHMGYRVICAASPVNYDYVKSLGAEVVLNRWAEPSRLVEEIRDATDDNVRIAIDNVGKVTAGLCYKVLQGSQSWRRKRQTDSVEGNDEIIGRLVPLAGFDDSLISHEDAFRTVDKLRISFSTTFYAQADFAQKLLQLYTVLLESRKIVPARIQLVDGGLDGIEKGLDDLRRGRVPGGYKLVARLDDTRT